VKGRIRLLLADGLRGMLSSEPDVEVVGEAANGEELLRLVERIQADVALVDLRMPVMDGVTAIGLIRERRPEMGVLVLTTYDTDADIRRAVEAGATGYILKDAPRDELYRAIRATAEGQSHLSPAVAARLMHRVREPGEEALSGREIEVLNLVAQGMANKEIARKLHLSEATVKTHLIHVFAKLGAADRTHAVTLAAQRGIIRLEG
jgi:DNA-binding NarL/FixJ family response regulator